MSDPPVRAGPVRAAGAYAAAATCAALIAQQVAGKAVRDALFLSTRGVSALPSMMALAAALSIVSVLAVSRLMPRHSPAKLMPVMFAGSAVGLALEWGLGLLSAPAGAVAVYLHTALLGPALITTFWSLVNERFDPHSAKKAVARISVGGTVGGVLGGLAAWRAATLVPLPTAVLLLAALNAACFVGALFVRARPVPSELRVIAALVPRPAPEAAESALATFRKTPFLRSLAMLVALGAASSSLLDYVFSVQATAAFTRGPALLAFFSLFWLAVSVLSFFLQLALGRLAMQRVGLAVNIAVLPGVVVMGSAVGIAVPGLASSAILRGAEAIHRNTLFRSAYELLYTPIPEERKRTTKAIVDVGFDRLGTMLGSGLAIATLYVLPRSAPSVLLGVVVALSLATFPVARWLHVGYVAALEKGLRDGASRLVRPPEGGLEIVKQANRDAREKVIRRAETLVTERGLPAASAGPGAVVTRDPRQLLAAAESLLSGNVGRARRVLLAAPGGNAPLAAFAILLLAHEDLHAEARTFLRGVAGSVTGQLTDALLDPAMASVVRRRIPRVLSACPSQRAVDGLAAGLGDARFEVRFECARALLRLTDGRPDLLVSRQQLVAAVLREVEKAIFAAAAAAVRELDEDAGESDDGAALADILALDRVDRRLEHVFTILGLFLEREPLRMAFAALHQADARQRGTALEYLETVLPSELRDAVWPHLSEERPLPTARSAQEILAELAGAV